MSSSGDDVGVPDDAADPSSFAGLGLDERVLRAVADVGYESPSPIQAATIPALLAGRHVLGLAQTGTGKTAAFALPLLSRLDPSRAVPQLLVLAPTRELALQVAEAIGTYAKHLPDVNVLPVYGGQNYGVQLAGLKRGAHVVVGTPGRVIDHLKRGTLDLSALRFLVLDEADEMLQMGFAEDVDTILAETPDDKQVALFSATMPPAIRRIAARHLTDAAEITVRERTLTSAATRQRWIQVAGHRKLDALTRVLEVEPFDAMIVFVRTKQATEDLADKLRSHGFSAAAINGDLVQAQRERTIGQLRNGSLDILVATDVAARGLDVDRISHVVNYDIPHDPEAYVHRIGRTGRAGRTGEALLFVTARERHLLNAIEKSTRQPVERIELPTVDEVNEKRVATFLESLGERLESPELGFFRELVENYAAEHDLPLADVAAALAVWSQDDRSFLLPPEPPPVPERAGRERRDKRPPRVAGERRGRGSVPMATYRIRVGRRHKVHPSAIVGALANEGGLTRQDFGAIDIRGDHTLVELPEDLPPGTFSALSRTRISGQLIALKKDDGSPADSRPRQARSGDDRPHREAPRRDTPRRDKPRDKPRHRSQRPR